MAYFGSKATSGLCQPLIAMMPPHDTYIETHLGGGAIMRRKPAALHNIGIDRDARALGEFECDYPVELIHGCAHRFLSEYAFVGSELLYSDPPYLKRTRTSKRRYRFDYEEADHVELLELLEAVPCQVMVSGYRSALYEERLEGWLYILGARLRRTKEVRDVVLSDTGPFETLDVERQRPDPMTLQVKEVTVHDTPGKGAAKAPRKPRRYVVCRNPDQARKDAATREQILAALESKLRNDGPKSVVANKGYKRYLKAEKGAFAVDLDKARDEERFDGMWALRTNTELSAVEVALRYKQLWMVEQVFRTAKSLLDTRPIFHKTDATICGHVFCSFLALVLRDELYRRMDNAGVRAEWGDILRDLNALSETTITYNGKSFAVRSNAVGVAGKIAQCVGVRLPNTVRQIEFEEGNTDPGS